MSVIIILDPNTTKYYGVYQLSGIWYQATSFINPTNLAVLDTLPEIAGTYSGTVFGGGEGVEAVDTESEIEVEFFAFLDGVLEGTLTTVSDATLEIIINLAGESLIENNHGRGLVRKLPVSMAWHGETQRHFLKGAGYEFRKAEIDIKETASIKNMLFGDSLANWQSVLGLPADGTIEEQEKAVKRKLSDLGGLLAADITNELHEAGFTDLYAFANKFSTDLEPEQLALTTQLGLLTQMAQFKSFVSIDPTQYQNFIPLITMGLTEQMGESVQMGFYKNYFQMGDPEQLGMGVQLSSLNFGADLVVNSSDDETDLWDNIPDDSRYWPGCFFISGVNFMDIVSVDIDRKKELRKLICEIKPFKSYALLFVEYN